MNYFQKDCEYNNIVNHVLKNPKFLEINNCRHHGITRLEHSFRVSYFSYKITKKLRLDYKNTAVASLLHDFFTNDQFSKKELRLSAFRHPKKCLENASEFFSLSDMQKDIIYSHTFPLIPTRPPKYLESWLVSMVDNVVASYEFFLSYHELYLSKIKRFAAVMLLVLAKV